MQALQAKKARPNLQGEHDNFRHILEAGRAAALAAAGFADVRVVRYVGCAVTPDNLAIVAAAAPAGPPGGAAVGVPAGASDGITGGAVGVAGGAAGGSDEGEGTLPGSGVVVHINTTSGPHG